MSFVLDSSVTMAWCFEDEASDLTRALLARLAQEQVWVPLLWSYEISNVLLLGERHGRISAAASAEFLELLSCHPINIDLSVPGTALMVLARKHRLTSYDAAYLELAVRKGLPLATLDADLIRAATSEGVEICGHATGPQGVHDQEGSAE